MLEAVKRKRAMLQHDEEYSHDGEEELAPMSGSHKKDALLGEPEGSNAEENAETPEEEKNETALGEEGGFDHVEHASAPENSKNQFHDPKKDTHDEVDPNMHRNMAGEGGGLETKYDKMGVSEHKDVRLQSSKMAKHNMQKAAEIKGKEHAIVASKMKTQAPMASHGEDAHDAVAGDNEQMQVSPMKRARGKLEGFLSKLKHS